MVEQVPTGRGPDPPDDAPSSEGARVGPRPALAPDGAATGPADGRIDELFTQAVEQQLEEQRELSDRLGETVRRLEQVEAAVDRVRSRLDEALRDADTDGQVLREHVSVTLRDAVDAAAEAVRRDVSAELHAISRRVDRLVGSGLTDVASRLGGEVATLRSSAAITRGQRRDEVRTANRVRAMSERLDELTAKLHDSGILASERVADLVREATDAEATRVRDTVEEALGHVDGRLDELPTETRLVALRADLLTLVEDLLNEGLADVRRTVVRTGGEIGGVRERITQDVADLERQVGEVGRRVARTAAGLADRVDRAESRVGEHVARTGSRVSDRISLLAADLTERLDAILETLDEVEGEEARRELVLALTGVLDGHVCRTCGFVAANAGGLASHRRSHEAEA